MIGSNQFGHSVVCLTYNKVYDSIRYASKITRTNREDISKCCRGLKPYTINLEKTKLAWMYSKDYIEKYGEEAFWKLHRSTQDFYINDIWED